MIVRAFTFSLFHDYDIITLITGMTKQVSCYGSDKTSDSGDNWKVEMEKDTAWNKDSKVKLFHMDTQMYLGSHDKKFNRPIAGQQEVNAFSTLVHSFLSTIGLYCVKKGIERRLRRGTRTAR